jgi:23S rRNA (pseudouridine1915-N3)-methyltransferase
VALALAVVGHRSSIAPAVRIVLVCVGKVRRPFEDDVAHYERLLARHARLETVELSESDLDRESTAILKRIPADAHVWVLDREGRMASSEDLAVLLEQRRTEGRDLYVVIGGPFGLADPVRDRAHERLSLGPVTLPHQLARVVALEQLFRAHKIVLGQLYHY